MWEGVITAVCALAIAVLAWASAHGTVARECERLGAFYVGDRVFECKLKERR